MDALDIDGLQFAFPKGWKASKYDEWGFYRNHFLRQQDGLRAVDLVAVSSDKTAYLVEVKDYRYPNAEKPSDLPKVMAEKVLHTMAAMLPARLNASEPNESEMARLFLESTNLKLVLHVEQPVRRLPVVDLADVQQKLKRLLRAVDPHVKVVSSQKMRQLPWQVT